MTFTMPDLAMQNLAKTYVALGRSVPDSYVWETAHHSACVGDLSHGICNFAVVKELDREGMSELAEASASRRIFNTYISGEVAGRHHQLLADLDFALSFQLVQMVAEPRACKWNPALEEAHDRVAVAAFMVEQFFPGLPDPTRTAVIQATAGANDLRLLALREGGRILGAAMTSNSAGMMGLYNLCVDSNSQGRGLGTSIVESLLTEAHEKKLPIGLQCDSRLERWYAGLGFTPSGTVDVFVLSNATRSVIMK